MGGELTRESRDLIEEFVEEVFVGGLVEEERKKKGGGVDEEECRRRARVRILWFKNWVSLQSVRSLEHFHVLVRDVEKEALERWTMKQKWDEGYRT